MIPDGRTVIVMEATGLPSRRWTFLTNHARVLICIAEDLGVRLRDIANRIGITQRAAQVIVDDLEEAGYISRSRVGRRNTYEIDLSRPFRHPAEKGLPIHELIAIFRDRRPNEPATARGRDGQI